MTNWKTRGTDEGGSMAGVERKAMKLKKDYSRFFWPKILVPLVMADDLAEIARLEAKLHVTQDEAARQLAMGMSNDIREIEALSVLNPAQRLQAVRLAYPSREADRPPAQRIAGRPYTIMPEGIR